MCGCCSGQCIKQCYLICCQAAGIDLGDFGGLPLNANELPPPPPEFLAVGVIQENNDDNNQENNNIIVKKGDNILLNILYKVRHIYYYICISPVIKTHQQVPTRQ